MVIKAKHKSGTQVSLTSTTSFRPQKIIRKKFIKQIWSCKLKCMQNKKVLKDSIKTYNQLIWVLWELFLCIKPILIILEGHQLALTTELQTKDRECQVKDSYQLTLRTICMHRQMSSHHLCRINRRIETLWNPIIYQSWTESCSVSSNSWIWKSRVTTIIILLFHNSPALISGWLHHKDLKFWGQTNRFTCPPDKVHTFNILIKDRYP